MLTTRGITGSSRAAYALLFLSWFLLLVSVNLFAVALVIVGMREDLADRGLVFLVVGFAFCVGASICVGVASGVLAFGTRPPRVRSLIAATGGVSLFLFSLLLIGLPDVLPETMELDADFTVNPALQIILGLIGLPVGIYGIWCSAAASRNRKLARYFTILVCVLMILFSLLMLFGAIALFIERNYTLADAIESDAFTGLAWGALFGMSGIWGLYSAGRRPKSPAPSDPAKTELGPPNDR